MARRVESYQLSAQRACLTIAHGTQETNFPYGEKFNKCY